MTNTEKCVRCSTEAESPWANGVCERHNAVIKETIRKTMEESGCDLETAVVWAVSAKNSLSGHHGYSPNILLFGKNTNFPNIINNELPAMETDISSATVEKNLKTMNNARKAFIEAECSEKVKRALKHRVRTCNDAVFESNDKVYYKRNNSPKWKGPACVIGQDNKNIIIKHGGETVRVHPASLIHVHKAVPTNPEEIQQTEVSENTPDNNMVESDEETSQDNNLGSDEEVIIEPAEINELNRFPADQTSSMNEKTSEETRILLPQIKTRIAYKTKDSERLSEGIVHSRAGKATGKYRYHMNVQAPNEGEIKVLDFSSDVEEWHPITEVLIASSANKENINAAKEKELKDWSDNNVYSEVEDKDQHTISCRWVIETKKVNGLDITKARLCARGFEDEEAVNRRTDSPTCSKEALRITFAIMASSNWTCKSMDIKRAFLQGNTLDREIFIKPPKEANTSKLWRLNKCVYGLNEASRYWYNRVHDEFVKIGLTKSSYDDAMFYLKPSKTAACEGIIVIHVDDFLYGGSNQFENKIEEIRQKFVVGAESGTPFKYVGLSVDRTDEAIVIDQHHYIENVEEVNINNRNERTRVLNVSEQREYRGICGQLNWVASQTRPDLSFEVCRLSTSLNGATIDDLLQANKATRKCRQRSVSIIFPRLQKPLHLAAFCDASYANLKDGSSQAGMIVFLKGKNGKISPLSWSSRKIKRVCRSTLTAETMA